MKLLHKIYDKLTNLFLVIGAINGLAMLNIADAETWKRGFKSVIIGFIVLVVSMPLFLFLILGIGMAYLDDRYFRECE